MSRKRKSRTTRAPAERPPVVPSPQWSEQHYVEAMAEAAFLRHEICGARTKSGGICRRYPDPARNNGRCRFHGSRGGRPVEHGRYSAAARLAVNLDDIPGAVEDPEVPKIDARIKAVQRELDREIARFDDGNSGEGTPEYNRERNARFDRLTALIRRKLNLEANV